MSYWALLIANVQTGTVAVVNTLQSVSDDHSITNQFILYMLAHRSSKNSANGPKIQEASHKLPLSVVIDNRLSMEKHINASFYRF